ncbi:hypothetical protein [Rhodovulum sulfidophilum]|uniref:hypothetical protein n=1 Tax=Rhodovulum sulfidophilum TaxID=35806 RepID=UPI000950DAEB|nr:hypothetical protein [Rhodovulum sulfidophilum]MBL3553857.1 hypothetical protein [Rhodovulum sulfidophilum]OLS46990.1 hypothetical protein BV379_00925 [Rhodovulum sulfidophilum]
MKIRDVKKNIKKISDRIYNLEIEWEQKGTLPGETDVDIESLFDPEADKKREEIYEAAIEEAKLDKYYWTTIYIEMELAKFEYPLPDREAHPEKWWACFPGGYCLTPKAIEEAFTILRQEKIQAHKMMMSRLSMVIGVIGASTGLLSVLIQSWINFKN